MSNKIIRVGITQGDINGVGYELILKAFEDARMFDSCTPVIYGSSKALNYHRKAMDLPPVNSNVINQAGDAGNNRLNIINCIPDDTAVEFAQPAENDDKPAMLAIERAVADLQAGKIDVLVTGPSNKEETPYIEELTDNNGKALRILVDDSLRIALSTGKRPVAEVAGALTQENITQQLKILKGVLVRDFMITNPRIAVLSLNPGAGIKEQHLGKEEEEIIAPAVKAASSAGVYCFGPYSADDFFGSGDYTRYDAVLAMYADQGLIPFRTLSSGEGVRYAANLPYVVITPDKNASFEKAGKDLMLPDSMRQALYLSTDIYHNRIIDKQINANPLKKQYFERGSDNEKLDLTKDDE